MIDDYLIFAGTFSQILTLIEYEWGGLFMAERSVTEELVELLEKKKADFVLLSKLKGTYAPKSLRDRLNLKDSSNVGKIEKSILPYLGDKLKIKKGSRSKYLTFNQPDEVLLFRIAQKSEGKKPAASNIPFKKDEYLAAMNKLLEQGTVRVKLGLDSKKTVVPLLFTVKGDIPIPNGKNDDISENAFRVAFYALEKGQVFVDIYELRRRLNWLREDFDAMLRKLRDEGKIGLHVADASILTSDEMRDSFTDESGIRMGTITWSRGA